MNSAFFGLGVMGGPMAANLVAVAQHQVSVFDLDAAKTQQLLET